MDQLMSAYLGKDKLACNVCDHPSSANSFFAQSAKYCDAAKYVRAEIHSIVLAQTDACSLNSTIDSLHIIQVIAQE